jgi:hypothetical protein
MSSASIDRRAFLLLRTRGRERVRELSCERLYMRWSDARSAAGSVAAAAEIRADAPVGRVAAEPQEWEGEPPTEIVTQTVPELWAELERGLTGSGALVVTGREWLADPLFGREVESRLAVFVERGGRIE